MLFDRSFDLRDLRANDRGNFVGLAGVGFSFEVLHVRDGGDAKGLANLAVLVDLDVHEEDGRVVARDAGEDLADALARHAGRGTELDDDEATVGGDQSLELGQRAAEVDEVLCGHGNGRCRANSLQRSEMAIGEVKAVKGRGDGIWRGRRVLQLG